MIETLTSIKAYDKRYKFGVTVLDATVTPQKLIYAGLHQCYSYEPVNKLADNSEEYYGEIAIKRLLAGNRGHYSPLEHVKITFCLEGINHGTLQQLLRSRIGVSPSVQSFRYTSQQIIEVFKGDRDIEDVIYLRPVGVYYDRESRYEYTYPQRTDDLYSAQENIRHVGENLSEGMPSEQARGLLCSDYRQHAIVTFNLRSLLGFFDRRSKKDAQIEIQVLSDLLFQKTTEWVPEISRWYLKERWSKAILAP